MTRKSFNRKERARLFAPEVEALNLRLSTRAQNAMNKGDYKRAAALPKGVTHHPATGKFRARITVAGRLRSLGLYATPEEAGAVYRTAAEELFGDFVREAQS